MRKERGNPDFVLLVSNALSIIEDGKSAKNRTGSFDNPFADLRDALRRGGELASKYTHASVTIFLTKGTHFILLEEENQRYRSSTDKQNQISYSLTIK